MSSKGITKGRLTTKRFIRSVQKSVSLETWSLYKRDHFLEVLLSRDTEKIRDFLYLLMIQNISSGLDLAKVNPKKLYIASFREGAEEYVLGRDLISPNVEVPTKDQAREVFTWLKITGSHEVKGHRGPDDWFELEVTRVLDEIDTIRTILRTGIRVWEGVSFFENGEEIYKRIYNELISEIEKVRRNVPQLKHSKAPLFIQDRNTEYLVRLRETLALLQMYK